MIKNKNKKLAGGHNPPLHYVMPTTTTFPSRTAGDLSKLLSNDANPDSKKFTLSGNDNLKIQLDWIAGIKKQIDFLNKKEVLPDFQIYFKVEHRTQESCLVCSCGHHYNCHALDEAWEDGGCRIWNCGCKEFDS